jgi:siroheme synthase
MTLSMLPLRPLPRAAAAAVPPRGRRRAAARAPTTTTAAAAPKTDLVTCLLVGAGPGPLDLLTLRAADALRRADCVLYDDLGPSARAARELAPPNAALIPAGKRGTDGATGAAKQRSINSELIERCAALRKDAERDGRPRLVVRLKGGCPSVFSRAGSEMHALREAGVAFSLVPGVSSALAAPLLAGFPLTEGPPLNANGTEQSQNQPRRRQPGFVVLSGHGAASDPSWGSGASGVAAAVVLMGGRALPAVVERLRDNAGFAAETPVAVIRDAGGGGDDDEQSPRRRQRVWRAPLGGIVEATRGEDLSPCVVVVGDCCAAAMEADAEAMGT